MFIESGNEIPVELIQTLLKMAPTTEEELKLRLFTGELSQLGPAERFLKVLVDIPFAFKRLETLLFMFILREEASSIKESFATLEVRLRLKCIILNFNVYFISQTLKLTRFIWYAIKLHLC